MLARGKVASPKSGVPACCWRRRRACRRRRDLTPALWSVAWGHRIYSQCYGDSRPCHGLTYDSMQETHYGPNRVLVEDPCPVGFPETLTAARMVLWHTKKVWRAAHVRYGNIQLAYYRTANETVPD